MVALDGGVISTTPGQAIGLRLKAIHHSLCELLDRHAPDSVAIEEIYFGRNTVSAIAVGQASGVSMLAAAQRGLDCHSYTPQAIKKAVCGSGAAEKEQVQMMVASLLALPAPPTPDHAADALAVAICHAGSAGYRRAQQTALEGAR